MIAPGYRDEEILKLSTLYRNGGMRGPPEAPWCVSEQWLWNSVRIDARVGEKHYFPNHLNDEETESCETLTPTGSSEAETVTPEKCGRKRHNDTLKSSGSNLSLQSESKFFTFHIRTKQIQTQSSIPRQS